MMADLLSPVNPNVLREDELRQAMELLFYGYRDFTDEADHTLAELGLGRAHHRAIYFIGRNRGLPVGNLLAILKITKQSLSRVLQDLVAKGYVVQQTGTTDRRQRRLSLTEAGEVLERRLTEAQLRRIEGAYRMAGMQAAEGFRKVLLGLIDEADRQRLDMRHKS